MAAAPRPEAPGDRQLGQAFGRELARHAGASPQLRQAILLDLMGDNRSLWPALRHLIEQPGFEALLSDPSPAARLAGKDSLLQELATWCNQQMLSRTSEVLEGFLGLYTQPADAPQAGVHDGSADARLNDAAVLRLCDQGIEATSRGEHQLAIDLFTQALQQDAGNVAAYMQRGSVYAMLGNLGAAIEDFNAVLRLQPSNLEALTQRGRARAAMGLIDEARRDWQEASDLGHRGARALLEKQWRAGPEQEETARRTQELEVSSADQAATLRARGLAARDQGDHRQAVALFSQALQFDSSHAELYLLRGSLLAGVGELERALEDLSAVLQLDPRNAEALSQRGKLHEGLGQMDRARVDWEAASRKGHLQAREWLANDYLSRAKKNARWNNHVQVMQLITKRIGLGLSGPEDYLLRGKSHQSLKAFPNALNDFSRVLAMQPDNAEALLQRGHVLMALNRAEEARRDWRQAAALGHPRVPKITTSVPKQDGRGWQLLLAILLITLIGVGIYQRWPAFFFAGLASGAGYLFRRSSRD